MAKTICISKKEYERLKKKEVVADHIIMQLKASARDAQEGRVHRVR